MEAARQKMDARFGEALLTPVNEGSWLFVPVSATETLVIYQTRASLGGGVPDSAVESWAMSSLSDVLHTYGANAERMTHEYVGNCVPQVGGDNQRIPCF
jgi:hypothetical protein